MNRPPIFWINWGGIKDACDFFDVPVELDYPISFNLPDSSWHFGDAILIKNETTSFNLFVDIVYEFNSLNKKKQKTTAPCRLCIGLHDNRFIRNDTGSVRDRTVAKYYGRFVDGYNLISEKSIELSIHNGKELKDVAITINHEKAFLNTVPLKNYDTFISRFSTLQKGDLISLGTVYAAWNVKKEQIKTVHLCADSFDWKVSFTVEDSI